MSNYTKSIGFNSIDEFNVHLTNRETNSTDLIKGLAVVGGAVLVAWLLTRK